MEFKIGFVILVLSSLLIALTTSQDPLKAPKDRREVDPAELLFQRLFKQRRTEQLNAVKDMIKMASYEKQYKLVTMVGEKVFEVIRASRALLESAGYISGGSKFPVEKTYRDALSNILENTALFGELILRLPDMTQKVLKANNEWLVTYEWGLGFARETELLDKATVKLLDLVSMEMNLTERSPDYVNPHRVRYKKKDKKEATSQEKPKEKKKKKLKKGPKMSQPLKDEF